MSEDEDGFYLLLMIFKKKTGRVGSYDSIRVGESLKADGWE